MFLKSPSSLNLIVFVFHSVMVLKNDKQDECSILMTIFPSKTPINHKNDSYQGFSIFFLSLHLLSRIGKTFLSYQLLALSFRQSNLILLETIYHDSKILSYFFKCCKNVRNGHITFFLFSQSKFVRFLT